MHCSPQNKLIGNRRASSVFSPINMNQMHPLQSSLHHSLYYASVCHFSPVRCPLLCIVVQSISRHSHAHTHAPSIHHNRMKSETRCLGKRKERRENNQQLATQGMADTVLYPFPLLCQNACTHIYTFSQKHRHCRAAWSKWAKCKHTSTK